MPIEKTLSLQRGNVLHYRCLAGEPEMILDFTRAWREPFLALLALDEIENSLLPVGQHVCIILRSIADASSNEHESGWRRHLRIPLSCCTKRNICGLVLWGAL